MGNEVSNLVPNLDDSRRSGAQPGWGSQSMNNISFAGNAVFPKKNCLSAL